MENNNEPLNPVTDSLHCLEKDFEAKKENVPKMLGMIGDFSDEHGLPMDFSTKLVIVGDELISNIIKHTIQFIVYHENAFLLGLTNMRQTSHCHRILNGQPLSNRFYRGWR